MKSYIQVAKDIIKSQINNNKSFTLIKLENFTNPRIYSEIYDVFKDDIDVKKSEFIAKLSSEKYDFWINNKDYNKTLESMGLNGLVSNERLTAYRNMKQNAGLDKAIIFLMGTEAVEDQGGLEDFYTINPEIIEGHIGYKYSQLFKLANINLNEEECESIDIVYSNIFKVVQKDLFKLSNFIDSIPTKIDFNELMNEIFNNLYETWNIPNIRNILKDLNKIKKTKKIENIEKAYKFANRIAINNLQKDKKIDKLIEDANLHYEKNKAELAIEFRDKFPEYNNIEEVAEDLKKYIQGTDIGIKHKLFKCDFSEISKILKLKPKEGTKPPRATTPKIYGDQYRAMFLPILLELNELTIEEKENINRIDININKITLANTKSKDKDKDNEELKCKWKSMCRFMGGIEKLFNQLEIVNSNGEVINLDIYSEDMDEKRVYTFNIDNTKDLIRSGILKSSSQAQQKSKIVLEYSVYNEDSETLIDKYEYEWNIPETEDWIYVFNFINGEFEKLIQQKHILPIGVSDKLDNAFNVKNEEEFIYTIKDLDIEYIDILKMHENKMARLHIKAEEMASLFIEFIKNIKTLGLFTSIYDNNQGLAIALKYIKNYNEMIKEVIEDIKENRNKDLANMISKALLIVNDKEVNSKSIKGAMMMPYHPVMLEKIIERYSYLSDGFKEIFDEICESDREEFKSKVIINKYDRFDQLATITSGSSVMIGSRNEFISSNQTYGFYSLYGEKSDNYKLSSVKVDFEIEEEFSEITQNNPISSHISKTINDYLNTYPSKIDGINVGFVNYNDYNHIILGLHDIISKTEKSDIKFKLNVFIYTNDYTYSGKNYIKYWLEKKFTEDDKVVVKVFFKYLDLNDTNDTKEYINKNINTSDLIFTNNILNLKEIEPEIDRGSLKNKHTEKRYPSVYLPIPCNEERLRKVCISQNQFECEENYTQLMIYINNSNIKEGKYRIVKKVELNKKIEKLIEALHERGNWIVMLDENIDKEILTLTSNKVIGFTTGNGYFGEINTAISTKDRHLLELERFMRRRLKNKFNSWSADEIKESAKNCVNSTRELDGSEILKAINPEDESINNYLAYMLTSTYEGMFDDEKNKDFYIRKIVSLDSHSHLFDNQLELSKSRNVNSRPDFMIIEIPKENNGTDEPYINIKIKIIECKLAKENDIHKQKAMEQVEEGYNRLSKIWNSNNESIDKRFWFNQLYRILAYDNSSKKFDDIEYDNFISNKLSGINEGKFDIEFEKYIYAYWIDKETKEICDEEIYSGEKQEIKLRMFGNQSIKTLLTSDFVASEEYDNETKDFDEIEDNEIEQIIEKEAEVIVEDQNPPGKVEIDEDNNLLIDNGIISLLEKSNNEIIEDEEELIKRRIQILRNELEIRGIKIMPNDYIIGPDIVRIRVILGTGVDFSKIEKHSENMKLWLKINETPFVFISDGYVNIDIVRAQRQMIRMGDIFEKLNTKSEKYKNYKEKFYVLLGEDILGEPNIIDMSDSNSPHLLVAGQTGSGKSVLLNSMLVSIMAMYESDEVEMILIDPKQVELSLFEESPFTKNNHIAAESEEAIQLLNDSVVEMEKRYKLFRENRVKNITDYNKKYPHTKMKRILIVFDEFGAMVEESKVVKDKIEYAIKQLSQKARAAGIHMIICTQTPRADIITTTIRNNLTARIALKVADNTASGLIIDTKGAESLLGKGDMLVKTADSSKLIRTKSPFIDEDEVYKIIDYINE